MIIFINRASLCEKLFLSFKELPTKRSQFTNLTINDKTNKMKKTALTKADVDAKVVC